MQDRGVRQAVYFMSGFVYLLKMKIHKIFICYYENTNPLFNPNSILGQQTLQVCSRYPVQPLFQAHSSMLFEMFHLDHLLCT